MARAWRPRRGAWRTRSNPSDSEAYQMSGDATRRGWLTTRATARPTR